MSNLSVFPFVYLSAMQLLFSDNREEKEEKRERESYCLGSKYSMRSMC